MEEENKKISVTFLPTSLLCRLNAVRASFPFSSLSIKRLVSFSPNLMSSLQPPHCQPLSAFGWFLVLPHLHPGILLSLHWRVSSCVMAAELMAWRKAVSRVADMKRRKRINFTLTIWEGSKLYKFRKISFVCKKKNVDEKTIKLCNQA